MTLQFEQAITRVLPADFIYSEYASTLGYVGNNYRKMVWQIAEDYACASVLLRLPGYSPMPAFGEVIDVPLVVRHAQKSKAQVGYCNVHRKSHESTACGLQIRACPLLR